jgi:hypothetical protein
MTRLQLDGGAGSLCGLLEALLLGRREGYDDRGNARMLVEIGGAELVVAIDEQNRAVLTVWRKRSR